MRKTFIPGMLLTFLLLLSACGASIKMIGSWMDNSVAGYQMDNVLVIGISRKDITRNLWENTFVELLGKENLKAQASHVILSGQEVKPERESIVAAVQKSGAESVLITRVVDRESETKTLSGFVHYEPVAYYSGMYDYYGYAYRAVYNPPVNVNKTTVRLETNLYDVATERLVWTAQSEAVDAKLLKTDFAKMVNLLLKDLREKELIK